MNSEMTKYAFISHMEEYMKKLLSEPLKADTDDFLKSYGIDGEKALSLLTNKTNADDPNSAIVIKTTSIKDNGVDSEGNKNKDTFVVKYKIPRKNYTRKMRNLYIKLFENNIVENNMLTEEGEGGCIGGEGATSADSSGQYNTPLFSPIRKTLYITEKQAKFLKEATVSNGAYVYDAPISKGYNKKQFYDDALNHKDIMKTSWEKNERI